jgi:hypothetical protein
MGQLPGTILQTEEVVSSVEMSLVSTLTSCAASWEDVSPYLLVEVAAVRRGVFAKAYLAWSSREKISP